MSLSYDRPNGSGAVHSHPVRSRRWRRTTTLAVITTGVAAAMCVQACGLIGRTPNIWQASTIPAVASASDSASVELGTRFFSDVAGTVTGVRFYRGVLPTGIHDGRLWSNTGRLLASARFTNEHGPGWQQVTFSKPVTITAKTPYVVSYHASQGHYAYTYDYFSTTHATFGPLHAWVDGRNGLRTGLYHYATDTAFPDRTFGTTNYWVDAVFVAAKPPPSVTTSTTRPSATTSTTRPVPTPTTATTQPSATTTQPPPTTTPPIVGQTNCAPRPSVCGYPDATNTGVPAGTVLTAVPAQATSGPGWHWDARGWLEVDGNGAVVDHVVTTAGIVVDADNVTIKRSRVDANTSGNTEGDHSSQGIKVNNGSANTLIVDSEIYGSGAGRDRLEAGIQCQYDVFSCTVQRVDIWYTTTAIQMNGGLIQDSYIHDLGVYEWASGVDHLNGITSNAEGGLTVRHNTVFNPFGQTDAVSLFQDFGGQANDTIDDNLLAGGGYTIYGGDGGQGGATSNIRITNNRISPVFFANGGQWGWLAYFTDGRNGNVSSGNVRDQDNQPLD